MHLPPDMVRCTQVFKDYYDQKNSKRRLTWMFGLGNATVRGVFAKGKSYDLQVTTLQALTMLAFNADEAETDVAYDVIAEVRRYTHANERGVARAAAR